MKREGAAVAGMTIAAEAVFAVSTDCPRGVVLSPTNDAGWGYEPLYPLNQNMTDALPATHRYCPLATARSPLGPFSVARQSPHP